LDGCQAQTHLKAPNLKSELILRRCQEDRKNNELSDKVEALKMLNLNRKKCEIIWELYNTSSAIDLVHIENVGNVEIPESTPEVVVSELHLLYIHLYMGI
jgi:hypothetical protein